MNFLCSHLYKHTLTVVLFALAGLFSQNAYAQNSSGKPDSPSFWVDAGPSVTTLGVGFSTGLYTQIRDHYFALKTNSTELSYWEETWDVSFIYGRHAQRGNFKFYAGTGVSVLGGISYTSIFESNEFKEINPVIGFPLNASANWHPVKFLGIGLHVFANINTEQPFGGLGITLQAGRFQQ